MDHSRSLLLQDVQMCLQLSDLHKLWDMQVFLCFAFELDHNRLKRNNNDDI